jgi:fumarate hydratase subunit beta
MEKINVPFTENCVRRLKVGDEVLLDGVIYTARDQAHQQLVKTIRQKKKLPIPLMNQVIYYCGPNSGIKNRVIGSCGPTTSSRMDVFTEDLLKQGLKGMIGKGERTEEIRRAIKRYKAIYFLTIAGAGALLSTKVKKAAVVAYNKFGPEAIYRLEVENFPLIVGIDSQGNTIFRDGSA